MSGKKRGIFDNPWPWIGGVFAVLLVAVGVFWLLSAMPFDGSKETENDTPAAQEPEPEVVRVSGRMMLTGNIFWGRRTNKVSRASELGVAYPFSGLAGFEREGYTDWMGGLECPVTEKGGVHNAYEEETLLQFNCDPDYLPEFAKWFTGVSLGNNHTDNQGKEGFAETKEQLTKNGIQFFGHYNYRDTEEVCKVLGVNVWEDMSDGARRIGKLPMAFCGHHGVLGIPVEDALAKIAEYAKVMPVVAMPHMGVEYEPGSNPTRQNVYRKMIDYGAEFVAGDHPHWVQNAEAYKGKLILYSMGNFMFDQDWNEEVRRSAALAAGFSVSGAEGWGEITEECVAGGLTVCAELVSTRGLTRYGVKWEFEPVGSYNVNLVTTRADERVMAGIMSRLGWTEVVKGLTE